MTSVVVSAADEHDQAVPDRMPDDRLPTNRVPNGSVPTDAAPADRVVLGAVPAPAEPPQWWVASRERLAKELTEMADLGVRVATAHGPELGRLAMAARFKAAAAQLLAARVGADLAGGVTPW